MKSEKNDLFGNLIIATLLGLLAIAAFISYKSIDWAVLKRMEATPLNIPTPATNSSTLNTKPATPSAAATAPASKK